LKELLAVLTIRALSIAFPAYPNVIAFRAEASSEPPEAAARAVTPEIEYPLLAAVPPRLESQYSVA
jgi:hypothetical protein